MTGEPWTKEREELLRKLWNEGYSGGRIAKELGGLTRNAVVGKAWRIGLRRDPETISINCRPTKKIKAVRKAYRERNNWRTVANKGARWNGVGLNGPVDVRVLTSAPLPNIQDQPGRYQLTDLQPHMCKWPIGDPQQSDFGFCGKCRVADRPYCAEHVARANIPLTKSQIRNIGRAHYWVEAA